MSSSQYPPDTPTEMVLIDDIARELQVNIQTLRRWEKQGRLVPSLRIGRVVRYRRSDVIAQLLVDATERTAEALRRQQARADEIEKCPPTRGRRPSFVRILKDARDDGNVT